MFRYTQLIVPLLMIVLLAGCNRRQSAEPLLIGHLAPLSGPDKLIGEHARQGIALALEEANKEGEQSAGGALAVLHVDTRGDPETMQPEAVRLIKINKILALYGGQDSGQAERLARTAQPYELGVITPAELSGQQPAENLFSMNARAAFEGQVLAQYAADDLKVKRVAVLLDSRRPESSTLTAAFARQLKLSHVAVDEWSYKSEAELLEAVDRLKQVPPDAILDLGSVADLAKLRGKLRTLGLKPAILLAGASDSAGTLVADRNAGDGTYLATPYLAGAGPARAQEFDKKYQERYHEPPDAHAALAYDAIRLVCRSLQRLSSPTAFRLRGELTSAEGDFEGLSGPLTFDKEHSARRPLFVVQVAEGQLKMLKRYDAEQK